MDQKRPNSPVPPFWCGVWGVIYLTIILSSLFYPNATFTAVVKISSIALCLFYVIIYSRQDHLLTLAMITTLIADLTLALDNTAVLGVICFLITQIIHAARLLEPQDRVRRQALTIFVLLSIIFITMALSTNFVPPMFVVAPFYLVSLSANIYLSGAWRRREPQNLRAQFAFFGFILFLSCDLCVGISYLSFINLFPTVLYAPANFLAWFFYYPAQILISNSTKYDKIAMKERNLC